MEDLQGHFQFERLNLVFQIDAAYNQLSTAQHISWFFIRLTGNYENFLSGGFAIRTLATEVGISILLGI